MTKNARRQDTRHPSYIFVSIALVVAGMLSCFLGFNTAKTIELSYDDSASKINYQVCSFDNSSPLINACAHRDVYVANLIEYITANYNYLANFSAPVSGDLSYQLIATVSATENNSGQSYEFGSREYPLTEIKTQTFSDAVNINLSEDINIDYENYVQIMDDFRKISATAEGSLSVELRIAGKITTKELAKFVDFNSALRLELPLTQQDVRIATSVGDENVNKNYHSVVSTDSGFKFAARCFSLISFVTALILALLAYLSYHEYNTQHYYEYSVRKIRSAYDNIIVDLRNPLDLKGYKIREVTDFDELIDAYNTIHQPINFYQTKTASHFVVLGDSNAWRYSLSAADYKIRRTSFKRQTPKRKK